jgi:hypothetical protein
MKRRMTVSVEQMMTGVSRSWQIWRWLVTIWSHSFSQGCQSGLMDLTVNQAGSALRRFESYPLQCFRRLIELVLPHRRSA